MENNLTKEENIILDMLLAKRERSNSVKQVKKKTKKELEIIEREEMRLKVEIAENQRQQRKNNINSQSAERVKNPKGKK
jgi:hypothetical protein